MPKVSVIVPVYKTEDKLNRCIDSILAQTFTDFELVLVDDGSPDRCGEICDEYEKKDARVKVIHKENGGVGAAKNTGIENAAGEYLSFVDSDDFIDPDYLETLCGGSCACDMAIAGVKYLSPDTLQSYNCLDYGESRVIGKADLPAEASKLLVCRALNYHVAKLYRRQVVEANGIRFTDFKKTGADDTIFNFDVLARSETVEIINKCIYNYITYDTSTSRSFAFETFERRVALDAYLAAKTAEMGVLTAEMQQELDRRFVYSSYWSASSFAKNKNLRYSAYKRFFRGISGNGRFRAAYERTKEKVEYGKEIDLLFQNAPLRFLWSVRQTGSRIKGAIYRFVPPFIKTLHRKRKARK